MHARADTRATRSRERAATIAGARVDGIEDVMTSRISSQRAKRLYNVQDHEDYSSSTVMGGDIEGPDTTPHAGFVVSDYSVRETNTYYCVFQRVLLGLTERFRLYVNDLEVRVDRDLV